MRSYDDFTWASAERLSELAAASTPWAYYLHTQVWFDAGQRSGTVRPVTTGAGDDLPPWGPLHVVTAIQPDSDPSGADSAARMEVLDRELAERGLRSMLAVGSSFDGDHSEDSRAVFGLDDAGARALGLRFGQVAVFSWSGPRWSLLACATERRTDRAWRWCRGA